ncbi:MAG: N-acetylmuramoyl-L-alanine amidase [Bacteriovoracia bacterium]
MKVICALFILLQLSPVAWSKVVLIDPGHGGEETGAIGKLSGARQVHEKDLALRLSLKIKKYLERDASVFLTRSHDRTVGLQERADMADKVKADFFISVHFNSSTDPKAHGFETYYLDNSADAAVKKVEKQENYSLKGEDLVVNQILIDLTIQQTVKASRALAQSVHKRLRGHLRPVGLTDRGVKPGLFYVLALSKRPGLLLEAGFMSNMRELKSIQQEEFMERYAQGVAAGIRDFLKR